MTSAAAVTARRQEGAPALGWAGLVLLGGILTCCGGVLGVVTSYDHSPLGMATGAVWVVLLPGIIALVLSGIKPAVGLALTAGAGVVALARLVSDVTLLTGPNTAVRPELFYEITDRAQPFTTAGGAGLVVVGDLVMVLAGTMSARRLGSGLALGSEPFFDADPAVLESFEPGLPAEADGLPDRNNWLMFAGFVGVLALLTASLGLPYRGGYLDGRYLPPELDLWGIGAALVGALLASVAVLVAAVLGREVASALLGGVAVASAVPFLTALAVRAAGAPVHLSPTVAVGLAGAVVLAAAGWLGRAKVVEDDHAEPSGSTAGRLNMVGAVLTLLVAGAGAAGWLLPQLRYNGGADPPLADGFAISAPLAPAFLVAMLIPLVSGLAWLIPPLAGAGRAAAAISAAALAFAVAQSLNLLGELVTSASVPNAGFAAPRWTAGPGLWFGIAGTVLGLAVPAVSVVASRQATDASSLVADDETLANARRFGAQVASGVTVVTVIALALPVYRTTAGHSGTLLVGFEVSSWGVLAVAVGVVAAVWAAARAMQMLQVIGYLAAAAATLVVRLVIPAAVRSQDGFQTLPGWYVGYAVVLVVAVAGVALAASSRRIRMTDPMQTPFVLTTTLQGRQGGGRGQNKTKGRPR